MSTKVEYELEVWYMTAYDDRDYTIIKVMASNEDEAIKIAQNEVKHLNRIYHNGKRIN